jgi:hypothetical protein
MKKYKMERTCKILCIRLTEVHKKLLSVNMKKCGYFSDSGADEIIILKCK